MFILCKKNVVLDGSHPALLYAYGGTMGDGRQMHILAK